MSEYEHRETIEVEPQRVFDFVSDIRNLPEYLPTVDDASPQATDRVRVRGQAAGHGYDNDGYYHVDRSRMRMEWGSDGENEYRGWLHVQEADNGLASTVTVHLSFEPRPELAQQFERQSGDRDRSIHEGLRNALDSIKNLCEGRGGKVEPRGVRAGSPAPPSGL